MPKIRQCVSLGASDLKPGVRFEYGAFYGLSPMRIEVLRPVELRPAESGMNPLGGLSREKWWSRNLDTGEEGYITLGPGGFLCADAMLGAAAQQPRQPRTKKSRSQIDRDIRRALRRRG